MNILMLTNTFTPHVGGVARSVAAFSEEYRKRGHRVLVVAPEFENQPRDETDVIRVPAIQHFNGSDFSVVLPVPRFLAAEIEDFAPDVVHSHHPFLLGATALRIAHYYDRPLIFTHHTMYEQYTHYVPGDSAVLKRFAMDLATHYANLCDQVVAPSETIAEVLRRRGVRVPVAVIPTGVRVERFAHGDRIGFRTAHGIPEGAFVIGHVGRLAPEKNLAFLAEAVARFLADTPEGRFLVVGRGSMESELRKRFAAQGLADRLHMTGALEGARLVDAYHAMDAFAFASQSETQGLVVTEAMAAGVPVIALEAPGVSDVMANRRNGRLLEGTASAADFCRALQWLAALAPEDRQSLVHGALETARAFSMDRMAENMLASYVQLELREHGAGLEGYRLWAATRRMIAAEWKLLRGMTEATGAALRLSRGKQ